MNKFIAISFCVFINVIQAGSFGSGTGTDCCCQDAPSGKSALVHFVYVGGLQSLHMICGRLFCLFFHSIIS